MAIPSPPPPPPLTELVIFVHVSYLSTHTVYRYNMQFFHYGVHVSYLSTHTVYQYNMQFFHYGGGHHNEKNACYTGKLYGWYLSMFHTCQPIQFTGITCSFFVMVPVIPVNCMSWQVGNMDKYHQLGKRTTACNMLTTGILRHNWCANSEKLVEDVEQHNLTCKGASKETYMRTISILEQKRQCENCNYPRTEASV